MKKILISLFFIQIFTLSSISAELKDCSLYNKFNPKYLVCKTANFTISTKNYQSNEWSEEKDKKIKKIKKIKNIIKKD
jgi:hypothetical protein